MAPAATASASGNPQVFKVPLVADRSSALVRRGDGLKDYRVRRSGRLCSNCFREKNEHGHERLPCTRNQHLSLCGQNMGCQPSRKGVKVCVLRQVYPSSLSSSDCPYWRNLERYKAYPTVKPDMMIKFNAEG